MKSQAIKVALTCGAVCLPLLLCAWGCAPQEAASTGQGGNDSANAGAGSAIDVAWSPEIDCVACHADEAATSTDAKCLAGSHTVAQSFKCVTCHADEGALTDVHQNMNSGKVPKKLKSTSVDQALCLTCHDKGELAEKTAASTVLTDDRDTAVNPHALPDNADHANTTCTNCHKGHSADGVQEEAPSYCTSCHHENVYECGTCHE